MGLYRLITAIGGGGSSLWTLVTTYVTNSYDWLLNSAKKLFIGSSDQYIYNNLSSLELVNLTDDINILTKTGWVLMTDSGIDLESNGSEVAFGEQANLNGFDIQNVGQIDLLTAQVYKTGLGNYASITKGATDNLTITEGTGQIILNGKTAIYAKVNSSDRLYLGSSYTAIREGVPFRLYSPGNTYYQEWVNDSGGKVTVNNATAGMEINLNSYLDIKNIVRILNANTLQIKATSGGTISLRSISSKSTIIEDTNYMEISGKQYLSLQADATDVAKIYTDRLQIDDSKNFRMNSTNGSYLALKKKQTSITVTTGNTSGQTTGSWVPDNIMIFGVTYRVTQTTSTATEFYVGRASGGSAWEFGTSPIALGTTGNNYTDGSGLSAPEFNPTATEMSISLDVAASGTDFIVRVDMYYWEFTEFTS